MYDCVVIGGGPAGLTAAIYLCRFNRSVAVIDHGHGRYNSHEINENYFGFPQGIHSLELRNLGLEQAKRFGAEIVTDQVSSIEPPDRGQEQIFTVKGTRSSYQGKTIIFATGVKDIFPEFHDMPDYIGRTLFWCITCDGYKVQDKKVMIVGSDNDAVCTCLQFLNFTKQLTFVTNKPKGIHEISDKWMERLKQHEIPFYEGRVTNVKGEGGIMTEVELDSGEKIATDFMFNERAAIPNSKLAVALGVKVNEMGYIETDDEQRTNVPYVYAAGDVTRRFAHQIVTAAHEGSMAGQRVNYDLYLPEQRED